MIKYIGKPMKTVEWYIPSPIKTKLILQLYLRLYIPGYMRCLAAVGTHHDLWDYTWVYPFNWNQMVARPLCTLLSHNLATNVASTNTVRAPDLSSLINSRKMARLTRQVWVDAGKAMLGEATHQHAMKNHHRILTETLLSATPNKQYIPSAKPCLMDYQA